MSFSKIEYLGDGVSTVFSVPFPYVKKEHVFASDSSDASNTFTFLSDFVIRLDSAIPIGDTLTVYRQTPVDTLFNYFNSASVLEGAELDQDFLQSIYALQEIKDVLSESGDAITEFFTDINMNGKKIYNLGDADLTELNDAANVNTVQKLIAKYNDGGAVLPHTVDAIAGQTDFILPFNYTMGIDALAVYVAGVRQSPRRITELTPNSFRLGAPCDGVEEVFVLISDQPANAVTIPQATSVVLGAAKIATVPMMDAGTDSKTIVTPSLLKYELSKLDAGGLTDNGEIGEENNIEDVSAGKYYVNDYSLMVNAPVGLAGRGVIIKQNNFDNSTGGVITAHDENGNVSVKVKVSSIWQSWNKINQTTVISETTPIDDDGRPDGTVYYKIIN